jgi:hypothetical protein
MSGSNFMQGWMVLAGSLALIALILTAFGHARHREACRCTEARWSHPGYRHRADADPRRPCGCLVGQYLCGNISLWSRLGSESGSGGDRGSRCAAC